MSDRRRRLRGRIATPPLDGPRAWVGADGSISLTGGNTYRIGFVSAGAGRRIAPGGEPPVVRWRESRGRIALTSTVFASAKGVFVKLEAENPFREARPLSLVITLRGRGPFGGLRATGSRLVSSAGETLLDITGAKASPPVSRRGGDEAVLDLEFVLPPRGRRLVELVLEPAGRTRARSFGKAYSETLAAWEALSGSLAVCRVPDETLAAAFDRAWFALVGSLSGGRSRPWPRPGLEPKSGPATLDALALRALDEWGGGGLVEDCWGWLLETRGTAAPPGDSFGSARGFLSLPPGEDARERWGSDCGALLWAMCSRTDIGARPAWFRSIRRGVEDACAWTAGELGVGGPHDGLLPRSRGPRVLGRPSSPSSRAWNDSWSWRGLDAAARMLEGLAALPGGRARAAASKIRAAADGYREAVTRAYSGSRECRECLERMGVTGAPAAEEGLQAGRLRSLHEWADALASASLTPEGELRAAVFFLRTLRRLLVEEPLEKEEGGRGGRREKAGALRIFPGVPPAWLEEGSRLEIERMPTSAGPVTVRAMAAPGGRRLVVEVHLPKGAPPTALLLGRRLGDVRVNGRRASPSTGSGLARRELPPRRASVEVYPLGRGRARHVKVAAGLVWLPRGGGTFDVSAEIAGLQGRSRRRKTRPK